MNAYDVARRADITYRQLDYWLRSGAIVIDDDSRGSGHHRQFTEAEADDIVAIGRIVREARRRGIQFSSVTIADMWAALVTGRVWSLSLSTERVSS